MPSNSFFTKSAESSSSNTAKQSTQPIENLAKLQQLKKHLKTYSQAPSDENFAKFLSVYQEYLGLPLPTSANSTSDELKKRLVNTMNLLWRENDSLIIKNMGHRLQFKNLQINTSQKILQAVHPHISKDEQSLTTFAQAIYLIFKNMAALVSSQSIKLNINDNTLDLLRQYLNSYIVVADNPKVAEFLSKRIDHKQLMAYMIELFKLLDFKNLNHKEYLYLGKNYYLANTGNLTKSILESSQSCLIKARDLFPNIASSNTETNQLFRDKGKIEYYLNCIATELNHLKEKIDTEINLLSKFGYNF